MNVGNQTVITVCRCHQNVSSWKIDLSFVSDEAQLLIAAVIRVHPIPVGFPSVSVGSQGKVCMSSAQWSWFSLSLPLSSFLFFPQVLHNSQLNSEVAKLIEVGIEPTLLLSVNKWIKIVKMGPEEEGGRTLPTDARDLIHFRCHTQEQWSFNKVFVAPHHPSWKWPWQIPGSLSSRSLCLIYDGLKRPKSRKLQRFMRLPKVSYISAEVFKPHRLFHTFKNELECILFSYASDQTRHLTHIKSIWSKRR